MKIKGLEGAVSFKAKTLAEHYGLSVEQARKLKRQEEIDADDQHASALIHNGIAEVVEKKATLGKGRKKEVTDGDIN